MTLNKVKPLSVQKKIEVYFIFRIFLSQRRNTIKYAKEYDIAFHFYVYKLNV